MRPTLERGERSRWARGKRQRRVGRRSDGVAAVQRRSGGSVAEAAHNFHDFGRQSRGSREVTLGPRNLPKLKGSKSSRARVGRRHPYTPYTVARRTGRVACPRDPAAAATDTALPGPARGVAPGGSGQPLGDRQSESGDAMPASSRCTESHGPRQTRTNWRSRPNVHT